MKHTEDQDIDLDLIQKKYDDRGKVMLDFLFLYLNNQGLLDLDPSFPFFLLLFLQCYVDEEFDNNNEDGGGWSDLDNSEEEDSDLENSMNEDDDVDDDSEDDEIALQAELAKIR